MSELLAFVTLGFHHITDLEALDHILFLLALAAIYRGRDWRDSLWVITAFTVGHSVTLALAVTGALRLPTALIEFLIPVTIVVTGLENIWSGGASVRHFAADIAPSSRACSDWCTARASRTISRASSPARSRCRCSGSTWGSSWDSSWCSDWPGSDWPRWTAPCALLRSSVAIPPVFRLRVVAVSAVVVLVAARMAASRLPW